MVHINLAYVYSWNYRYEGGRVMQRGDGKTQCAVAINKAQESDHGIWICKISTLDKYDHAKMTTATINVKVEGNFILHFTFCLW
jgi:hypothetical protein